MRKVFNSACVYEVSGMGCLLALPCEEGCVKEAKVSLTQMKSTEIAIVRNTILKWQDDKCPICHRKITTDMACLDHDHQKKIKGTGKIRGVLCRTCNSLIAKSENNATRCSVPQKDLPQILRRMADYLETDQYPLLHPTEKKKDVKLRKDSYNKLVKEMIAAGKKPPVYPEKTKRLTMALEKLFLKYKVIPEFYS